MIKRNYEAIPVSKLLKVRTEILCPICKSRNISKLPNKHFGICPNAICQSKFYFIRPSAYQRKVINDKANTIIQVGAYGSGKCEYIYNQILTDSGIKNFGDLTIKDKVYGTDGELQNILKVHPLQNKKCYEVEFHDGSSGIFSYDHLWNYNHIQSHRRFKNWKQGTTEELLKYFNDHKNNSNNTQHGKRNHRIIVPSYKSVNINKNHNLPIDSYILGLLIGDGCLTQDRITFSTSDKETLDAFIEKGYKVTKCGDKYDYRISDPIRVPHNGASKFKITRDLEILGLKGVYSYNKFIPEIYKHTTIENRLALVQGLMDTDGTVCKSGGKSFTSKSEKLVDDLRWIIKSLGYSAIKTEKYVKYKGENRLYFNLTITDTNETNYPLFRIYRKLRRQRLDSKKMTYLNPIKSIMEVGNLDCLCITVSNENSLYLTQDFIVTHNTFASAQAFFKHMMEVPGAVILVKANDATQLDSTAKVEMLKFFDEKRDFKVKNAQEWILKANGARIIWSTTVDANALRSLNLTGAWILEANNVDPLIIDQIPSRMRNEAAYTFELDINGNRVLEWDPNLKRNAYKIIEDKTLYMMEMNPDYCHVISEYGFKAQNVYYTPSVLLDSAMEAMQDIPTLKYSMYLSSTLDSPYLSKNFLENQIARMTDFDKRRYLYCEITKSDSLIFSEAYKAIVKPFPLTPELINEGIFFIATDFGGNLGWTTVIVGLIDTKEEKIYIIDEDRTLGETFEANARMFSRMKSKYTSYYRGPGDFKSLIRIHIVDKQGAQTLHGQGSIISKYAKMGHPMVYPKNYNQRGVGGSLGIVNNLISEGKLVFTSDCVNLIKEINNFTWTYDAFGNKSVPAESKMRRFDLVDTVLIFCSYFGEEWKVGLERLKQETQIRKDYGRVNSLPLFQVSRR